MNGSHTEPGRSPNRCQDLRSRFQDYLDESLSKSDSLEIFLHLRDCEDCRRQLEGLRHLYEALQSLPAPEIPAGFNERILASVPLSSYRAMEPLRRDRVPVVFTEEFLPAFVRAVPTRAVGGILGLAALGGVLSSLLPDGALAVTVAGVLPEFLVRIQHLGRRAALALQR